MTLNSLKMVYTTCKDDLLAYSLYILILFVLPPPPHAACWVGGARGRGKKQKRWITSQLERTETTQETGSPRTSAPSATDGLLYRPERFLDWFYWYKGTIEWEIFWLRFRKRKNRISRTPNNGPIKFFLYKTLIFKPNLLWKSTNVKIGAKKFSFFCTFNITNYLYLLKHF